MTAGPAQGASRVRLSEFILHNMERILSAWEEFATTIISARGMDQKQLRNHAAQVLAAVAHDMELVQSEGQRFDKSKGLRENDGEHGLDAPSQSHGLHRLDDGFSLNEMVSEYRALRASVLRLWAESIGEAGLHELDQLTRFNEAIDQAMSASIRHYDAKLTRSKELLLGVLGHDLRNPLAAVMASGHLLVRAEGLSSPSVTAAFRIISSAERMAKMIDDLLDFTRARLGAFLPIFTEPADLRAIVRRACDEMEVAHPDRQLKLECDGNLWGTWDPGRVAQMLSNLIGNAIQHGAKDAPITITAKDAGKDVILAVHNRGAVIAQPDLRRIFEPLFQANTAEVATENRWSLGLGLYIAQQIAVAHWGEIDASSSQEAGTTFSARLPRDKRHPHVARALESEKKKDG